jgi:hypothetical protein
MSCTTYFGTNIPGNRPRLHHKKARRAIVLAVVLAGMVLLLLMLGGMARRVLIEHKAIDACERSLQANWLLWSAENRAAATLARHKSVPQDWNLALSDSEPGKSITARVLDTADKSPTGKAQYRIELIWTTPQGVKIERSRLIEHPESPAKGAP